MSPSTEHPDQKKLTEEQRRMYAAEKLDNFRWLSKIVATYSPYTLTAVDRAPVSLYRTLADFGERYSQSYNLFSSESFPLWSILLSLQDNLQKSPTAKFQLTFYSSNSHH